MEAPSLFIMLLAARPCELSRIITFALAAFRDR
jgi:hypothetical protein